VEKPIRRGLKTKTEFKRNAITFLSLKVQTITMNIGILIDLKKDKMTIIIWFWNDEGFGFIFGKCSFGYIN
jgi:hypothetical protein